MHHHGAVWNALLWGRKLWALLPPSRAAFAPAVRVTFTRTLTLTPGVTYLTLTLTPTLTLTLP